MDIKRIAQQIDGRIITQVNSSYDIEIGLASDLMSDILTLDVENAILITGLNNMQTIRTLEMSDIHYVVIGRGRDVSEEMILLAEKCNIVIVESPFPVFRICGILYNSGLKPPY